jgi:hypothetical protein
MQLYNKKVFIIVNAENFQKEAKSDYGKIQRMKDKKVTEIKFSS